MGVSAVGARAVPPTVTGMIVLGLDVGGTSVRCAVVRDGGEVLGFAREPGANFRSSGPEGPLHLRRAVERALAAAGAAPGEVDAVGVGAAGAAQAGRVQVEAMLQQAWAGLGLPDAVLVGDLEVAFRSAAPDPEGVLLLAGTGAVAARFEGWELVARCDGMGWLLGDVGSGAWIGREVLRAAAAAMDHRGPETALAEAVSKELGLPGDGDPRQALIAAATPLPPSAWGRFAPLALGLDGADAVATGLLDRAAEGLLTAAMAVEAPRRVVFAGGLLQVGGLRRRLDEHFEAAFAEFPVVGACVVAADSVGIGLDREAVSGALAALA